MRTLSAELLAALGLTVTRPGYLVQIDFPTPVRLSTLGDIEWDGQTWTGADLKVRNLSADIGGSGAATLELGNADLAWSALVLGYGIARRRVQIWCVYAGVAAGSGTFTGLLARGGLLIGFVDPTDAAVAVPVFDGLGAKGSVTHKTVTISTATPGEVRQSPRKFINAAAGFQHLQPAGTRIPFNGETFVLERL